MNTFRKTVRNARKGITPVVAIVLLLMLTVAVAGGAYAWINGMIGDRMDEANNQLNTELEVKDLQCQSSGNIDFYITNAGDTNINGNDVDIYLYEVSDDSLTDTITGITSNPTTLTPGDPWDGSESFSGGMAAGSRYRVEFEFTSNGDTSVSETCRAS